MDIQRRAAGTPLDDKLNETLGIHSPAKLQQLLQETETLLRAAPPQPSNSEIPITAQELQWIGAASAVISQWDKVRAIAFKHAQSEFISVGFPTRIKGHKTAVMLLHEAQHDLRLRTVGPLNVAIDKGRVFDYFDELRDIIEQATSDLLFVDPYLSAEFISRYLPYVKKGVSVRLLTSPGRDARYMSQLLPAVDLFTAQNAHLLSVRTTQNLHDRYLFVDHSRCFASGSSFKDGAKNAGTTNSQMVDVFDAVQRVYEDLWTTAKVER